MKRRVNLTKGVSTSTGAERLVLTGVPSRPYRAFGSVLVSGDLVDLVVTNRDADQWQVATYVYDGGANALTFQTLIESSTGAPIDFVAGIKDIKCAPLAQDDDEINQAIEGQGEAIDALEEALVPLTPLPATLAQIEQDVAALEVEIGDLPVGNWSAVPYADEAAGIAATTNGQNFLVQGTGDLFAKLFRNVAGVSTDQGRGLADYEMAYGTRVNLERVTVVGRPIGEALVTHGGGTTLHRVSADSRPYDRIARGVWLFALGTGTIYITVHSISGNTKTFVRESAVAVTAGFHFYSLNMVVEANNVIGDYTNELVAYDGAPLADSGGFWAVGSHNTSTFDDASLVSTGRLELRVDLQDQVVTAGAVEPVLDMAMVGIQTIAGRRIQPTRLSATLHVIEGQGVDDDEGYRPTDPATHGDQITETWVLLAPVEVGDRMVLITELSATLQIGRGIYLDDGSVYDPDGPSQSSGTSTKRLYASKTANGLLIRWPGTTAATTKYIQVTITHTTNAAINEDVWRISDISEVTRLGDFSYGSATQICNNGETENAIKEVGASEHMGGSEHGNEEMIADAFTKADGTTPCGIYILVDGVRYDEDETFDIVCDELTIVQATQFYQVGSPDKYTPKGDVLLEDYKRLIFTYGGFDLHHYLTVKKAFVINTAYLAMLNWKGTDIVDTGAREPFFAPEHLAAEDWEITRTTASLIKTWGDLGYSAQVEMLSGWDKASRGSWIGSGDGRPKIYFSVASATDDLPSGYSATLNEVIASHARYTINTVN